MFVNFKPKIYILAIIVMVTLVSLIKADRSYYHPECGESPIYKYKELAKAIGKDLVVTKLKKIFNFNSKSLIDFYFQKDGI